MSSSSSGSNPIDQLAEEFVERQRRGEHPALTEYTRQYPDLADEIRELFPALVVMEQLKPAVGDHTGPYLDETARHPERLGDYRILREVGRGGMGVVYEAEQESLGRHVALKVLPAAALLDAQRLQRFLREAKAAARLHHTNIVPVFGVGEAAGLHFYVMQYIPGLGLHEVLEELKQQRSAKAVPTPVPATPHAVSAAAVAQSLLTGRFCLAPAVPADDANDAAPPSPSSPSTDSAGARAESSTLRGEGSSYWHGVARVGVQAAEALGHAHERGVLHRDVKPSNLLLDMAGNVWITDFGLAKSITDVDQLTHTGDIVGTLRYMAPERFNGQGDARSDVYSLGLTLYELLTLLPAFTAADRTRLIHNVMHEEPARPRTLNSKVPRDLETIVLKAIAKEPAQRYQTAQEFADDLQRFVADRPIQARRASPSERLWRWCRRNPALAAVSGLAVAALLTAVVVAVSFAIYQSRAAAELRQEQRQTKSTLAGMALDRGRSLGEQGDVGQGMLWLARGLEIAVEAEDADLQRVLRWNLAGWHRKLHSWRATFPHAGWVWAAAFSPDGKTVWTGCADKKVRRWDVATGQEIGPTLEHADEVRALAVSRDGKIIATGSYDRTARLWDAATGQPLCNPLRHEDQVLAVAISPDGKTVVTGGNDRRIRRWEVATGEPTGPPFYHNSNNAPQPTENRQVIQAVAFSPDGKTILTGEGMTARLWDVAAGRPLGPPLQHRSEVFAVAFSPDGKTFATGGEDFTARLWNAADGSKLGPLLQHEGHVRAVAFSPDGKTVVTASNDRKARLWDAATGKPIAPLQHTAGTVFAAAFSPDGRTVLTGDSNEARLWTVADQLPGAALHPQGRVTAMAFSPDVKTVVTGSRLGPVVGRSIRLWDAATGSPVGEPPDHRFWIQSAAFSPDGKIILIATHLGTQRDTMQMWDAATGKLIGPHLPHQGNCWAVAFSPNGKTIVTGGSSGKAQLWDAATRQPIGKPLLHRGYIRAVAFSPDGKTVQTGSADRTARLWDAATGEPLGQPLPHQSEIRAVAFSPGGKTLLSGCEDGTARLWDAATSQTIGLPLQHQGVVLAVAFSPDGQTVQTGSADRTARLWDAATGRPVGPPRRHPGFVHAVAFSPDGKTALSGSDNYIGRLEVASPVPGEVERLTLWVQVSTGMELGADGIVSRLDGPARHERVQRLQALGGPPLP